MRIEILWNEVKNFWHFKESWFQVNGIYDIVINWNGEQIAGYLIHLNKYNT